MAVACPGYRQVLVDSLGGAYDRIGITGVVKVQIRVRGNQIVEVAPQSGPREYYRVVQTAVRRMNCKSEGADEVTTSLEVSFRPE